MLTTIATEPFVGWLHPTPADREYTLYVEKNTLLAKHLFRVTGQLGSSGEVKTFQLRPVQGSDAHLQKVYIKTTPEGVKVGPIIGILTTASKQGGFSGNRQNFRDLCKASYVYGGIVYVFTPEGIDDVRKIIHGYQYHPIQRRWMRVQMPFPDVVYNRIPRREDERKPEMRHVLARLQQEPTIHLYNPSFFNKWDLYQWLHADPEIGAYLPETLVYSAAALQRMAKRHPTLYLKPIHGKAGIHFFKIEQTAYGTKLTHQTHRHQKHQTFRHKEELVRYVDATLPSRLYVIQQAIPLATFAGRPFDLRVLVQKNQEGKWDVSGIGARLSGKQAITTHVPQGGSIVNPDTALRHAFGEKSVSAIYRHTRQVALKTAQSLERHFQLLGELSIDIGIDRSGKPWIFEANAKPMKFDEPHIRETSIKRFFEFCRYLSGFTKRG